MITTTLSERLGLFLVLCLLRGSVRVFFFAVDCLGCETQRACFYGSGDGSRGAYVRFVLLVQFQTGLSFLISAFESPGLVVLPGNVFTSLEAPNPPFFLWRARVFVRTKEGLGLGCFGKLVLHLWIFSKKKTQKKTDPLCSQPAFLVCGQDDFCSKKSVPRHAERFGSLFGWGSVRVFFLVFLSLPCRRFFFC